MHDPASKWGDTRMRGSLMVATRSGSKTVFPTGGDGEKNEGCIAVEHNSHLFRIFIGKRVWQGGNRNNQLKVKLIIT